MNHQQDANARRLVEAVLTSPGETDLALRHAVEAYTAELGGRPDEQAGKLTVELTTYVNKVALHAYKTTDEDTEALRQAGYSEDASFGIKLSAAVGGGIATVERGVAPVK